MNSIKHNNFRIFHLNIRSIRKNFDEFLVYLSSQSYKYNIIVLTEVWIKDGEQSKFSIPGFNLFLRDRPDNNAGGVLIYVEDNIQCSHRLILFPTAEIINVTFKVHYNNSLLDISLYGVYRNCKFLFKQFKPEFENILKLTHNPTIIVGDLNVCTLNVNGSGGEYLDLLSSYGFVSYVNTPTRIFNKSVSCLDHVFIRNSKNIDFSCKVLELDITDHFGLELKLSRPDFFSVSKTYFVKTLDVQMLRRQLRLANWDKVYNENNVDNCLAEFYSVLNECREVSFFIKKINYKNRKRKDWISDNLMVLVNQKNDLFKCYSKNRDNLILKEQYKSFSRLVCRRIRQAKIDYYSGMIDRANGNSKKYWDIVRKIVKNRKHSLSKLLVEGNIIEVEDNELLIANTFNNYFSNIVSDLRGNQFGYDLFLEDQSQYESFFTQFSLTDHEVFNTIIKMKNKPSCGIDGVNIYNIKENIDVFLPLLCDIYKKSFSQGLVPNCFKVASVTPVFKSGDSLEVSSYRPISVINTIAKIFETIVKDKLICYFGSRALFSPHQYGFLPGKGTDLALEKHITRITYEKDQRKYTLSVYLDFQKAFDTLDINTLISKFKMYGISGMALKWLISFCTGRKQVVKINNTHSQVLELLHGTAQGGVLGPIIFLIYINDLLNLPLHSSIFAYADDTALVCSAYNRESLKSKIREDLNKVSEWLVVNKLLINGSKSKCLMFFDQSMDKNSLRDSFNLICHTHQCNYHCNCSSIEIVESVKYLGLYVDQYLKWDHHVNNLSKKLRKINYSLFHLKQNLRNKHIRQLYFSWFESVLRFGIIHYGGTFPTILKPVIMAQRQALRVIFGVRRMDRISYIFEEQKILHFNHLHRLCLLLHIHKYLDNFKLRVVNRMTRRSELSLLELPLFRLHSSQIQFCYLGPRFFNEFIMYYGNELLFYKKPKIKMKAIEYIVSKVHV